MHPAEVMALALESCGKIPQRVPDRRHLDRPAAIGRGPAIAGAAIGLGVTLPLILAWRHLAAERSPSRA
ncbi:MAG: hypothetical protein ACREFX_14570 [Opitutaceae bacterium]